MSEEERRTVMVTAGFLLLASLLRLGWEARATPPLVPGEPVPAAFLDETREAVVEEERRGMPLAPGELLDPNQATEIELDRLPGVGPALARRIVEYRETVGPFRASDDLLEVSGIGPATLARIAPLLRMGR